MACNFCVNQALHFSVETHTSTVFIFCPVSLHASVNSTTMLKLQSWWQGHSHQTGWALGCGDYHANTTKQTSHSESSNKHSWDRQGLNLAVALEKKDVAVAVRTGNMQQMAQESVSQITINGIRWCAMAPTLETWSHEEQLSVYGRKKLPP
jgi:hypothetical protein